MKKWFLLLFVWIYFPTLGQEAARVNYTDSCITGDGLIYKKDFLKLARLCHPQLKDVKSFHMIVISGSEQKDLYHPKNRWDPKLFKNIQKGTRIYFEEIKGIAPQGHFTKGHDIRIIIN